MPHWLPYGSEQAPALKSAHHLPSTSRRIFCPHGQKTGASVADFYPQGVCSIRRAAQPLTDALPFRCGEVATLSTGSGARYHRRGMGACEGVPWKSRSAHGGSGRFVARGRAADGEKLFSAEGRTWGQMGGNPVIAMGTGFDGAKRDGPENRRRVGAGRL